MHRLNSVVNWTFRWVHISPGIFQLLKELLFSLTHMSSKKMHWAGDLIDCYENRIHFPSSKKWTLASGAGHVPRFGEAGSRCWRDRLLSVHLWASCVRLSSRSFSLGEMKTRKSEPPSFQCHCTLEGIADSKVLNLKKPFKSLLRLGSQATNSLSDFTCDTCKLG